MVAECLRGVVFNEIGDIVNLCLKYKHDPQKSQFSNIATDAPLCFKKARARVVATSRKFPGFFKFSGYKQINLVCPDVVMTKHQMKILIDDTLKHFPALHDAYKQKVEDEYPASSEDLPKQKLYIKVAPNTPR